MKYTNEETMRGEILSPEKTMVVFSAEWCGPCKAMAPLLEQARKENPRIIKVDVDENRDLAAQMGIRSIPTMVVFQNGSVIEKKVGTVKSVAEIFSLMAS